MRKLLLVLILLNLAFFFWQSRIPVEDINKVSAPVSSAERPGKTLVLLREAEDLVPFSRKSASIKKENVTQSQCYTIGPFDKEGEPKQAAALLGKQIVNARTRVVEEEEHAGYWVYLPEGKTISDARRAIGKLNLQGVNDSMIVQRTKDSYVISVGVFTLKDSAERRKARMETLGYEPKMEDRFKVSRTYWLDFDYYGDEPLADLVQRDTTVKFPGLKHQPLNCK